MVVKHKAWIVAVDMGYGHQRAAYPLKDIAFERIITANSDKIISKQEKRLWSRAQAFYLWISRRRSSSLLGMSLFNVFDRIQHISPYYPFRDLSKPSITNRYIDYNIKRGLGKSLIEYVKTQKIPFITTFFIPALSASYHKLDNVYCVVTDVDINRSWVASNPKKSNVNYLVPTEHTLKRLVEYGVPKNRIFLTGFPLPKENLGGKNLNILKKDLADRLLRLDPKRIFISRYKDVIKRNLGTFNTKKKIKNLITITYAVGGAGAQKDTGIIIVKSLKKKIKKGEININLVAGTSLEVMEYFNSEIEKLGLKKLLGKNIKVIYSLDKKTYFASFNNALHNTDILWTKPSELCFYAALGIPIIINSPIGSQEISNKRWLEQHGAGTMQENPLYIDEWLNEWLNDGRLAESAWEGFLEIPKLGTYNIEELVFSKNKKKLHYFEL